MDQDEEMCLISNISPQDNPPAKHLSINFRPLFSAVQEIPARQSAARPRKIAHQAQRFLGSHLRPTPIQNTQKSLLRSLSRPEYRAPSPRDGRPKIRHPERLEIRTTCRAIGHSRPIGLSPRHRGLFRPRTRETVPGVAPQSQPKMLPSEWNQHRDRLNPRERPILQIDPLCSIFEPSCSSNISQHPP